IGVLEGGGSPAEINLRQWDLVNMGMAELIDAPVILVGNIETGGVFASLYGNIALLDENDRKRIKGVIINKFRGDVELLKPGIKMFEDRLQGEGLDIKVLGVVPYINLNIEEEDVLAKKLTTNTNEKKDINISVIRTNKMSNYTDFDALSQYPDVALNYVYDVKELGNEDIIILPGSKNTITDLEMLKANGIFDKIKELHSKGTTVVGICGGFQMLGKEIFDPHHIESSFEKTAGFGILDTVTTMEKVKYTHQVEKTLSKIESPLLEGCNGLVVKGYEIHQGVTKGNEINLTTEDNLIFIAKENSFGTYIHGIFDNGEFTRKFLNNIRRRKGLAPIDESFSFTDFKEREYDKLADHLRANLNIEEIYKILG
ncbi:MAG: cobyric acid synthase, partial [Fusobacterium sp.]